MPAWLVIGGVTLLIGLAGNVLRPKDIKWFRRLERPSWLTIEPLIPIIWITVFICGAWSAYIVWTRQPGEPFTWLLMGLYALLEVITVAYSPAMLWTHRLRIGTVLGGTGFVLCLALAALVSGIFLWATLLLLPYLLWSPVGTLATWQMEKIN
ncbi:MAG: tryptophan-rich sensory protein [Cyanobacteria bacterium P01_A01_bin.135]